MAEIHPLTAEQLHGPAFFDLLREAAGQDDHALRRVIELELPEMTIVGIAKAGGLVAFAAYRTSETVTTIEYIAVDAAHRSAGLGRELIEHIRGCLRMSGMLAETDDDAVQFYRQIGFSVSTGRTDARWPERQRYRCTIRPLGER